MFMVTFYCILCWYTNITCQSASERKPSLKCATCLKLFKKTQRRKNRTIIFYSHRYWCLCGRKLDSVQTWYISASGEQHWQPFFNSPFLSDDVIRAPDLQLAAAATHCTSEALPHFCWASATSQWDRMHSQGSCLLHPGLYRSLEPTGLP